MKLLSLDIRRHPVYASLSYLKSRLVWLVSGLDAQKVWREKTGKEVEEYANNDSAYEATENQLRFVLSRILERRPKALLEVGCGYGRILSKLSPDKFERIVGVDFSDAMLQKAKEKVSRKVELVRSDAAAMPFESDEFDLTYTSGVLMHIPPEKIRLVLEEINRVSSKNIFHFESVSINDFARFAHDYLKLYSEIGLRKITYEFLPPECNGPGDKNVLITVEKQLNSNG